MNYCALGVVPGDLVTLTGCTDNSQCGIGEECVSGDGVSSAAAGLTVTGICVDPNRAERPDVAVRGVPQQRAPLRGGSRLSQQPRSSGRTSTRSFCRRSAPLVTLRSRHRDGQEVPDSCPDIIDDLTTANFKCVSSYPGGGTGARCLMPCALNSDCRAGRLCVNFDTATTVPPFCAARSRATVARRTGRDCACTGPELLLRRRAAVRRHREGLLRSAGELPGQRRQDVPGRRVTGRVRHHGDAPAERDLRRQPDARPRGSASASR